MMDTAHPALEEVGKGKIMNKDCIFYTEIQDMHATISQCRRSTKFADCPCGNDCEHYIPIELARSMDIKPIVKCKNIGIYAETDQFICSNCGIELRGWYEVTVETNEIGDGELVGRDYAFKYCPNCGADMKGRPEK